MQRRFQTIVGYIIVIGIIAAAVAVILHFQEDKKPAENTGKYAELIKENILYRVVKVLDGDTLIANVDGHEVTVRMIGIDTPEVVDPRKPVQCYGPEASAKAKELLNGKEIYIEREAGREAYDKYGRTLGYIHFADKTLYNEKMIKEGYAREYTFNKEKYKYQKEFKADEKEAQKNKLGLWGACPTSL
jgi:micrococcal nuclease